MRWTVKYKLAGPDWNRGDLEQAIAFATIYQTNDAAIVGFRDPSRKASPDLGVGKMQLRHIDWVADPATGPEETANRLAGDIGMWLADIDTSTVAAVS